MYTCMDIDTAVAIAIDMYIDTELLLLESLGWQFSCCPASGRPARWRAPARSSAAPARVPGFHSEGALEEGP